MYNTINNLRKTLKVNANVHPLPLPVMYVPRKYAVACVRLYPFTIRLQNFEILTPHRTTHPELVRETI